MKFQIYSKKNITKNSSFVIYNKIAIMWNPQYLFKIFQIS